MSIFDHIGAQFKRPTGFGGRIATRFMNVQNRRLYDATEQALALAEGERALDVGFGNGAFMQGLSRKYSCDFYGIDISPDMVDTASKRNPKAHLSQGDITKTSYTDGFFDKVYSVNTVYFWSGLSAGFAEIHRILRGGGMFVNTLYSKEFLDRLPAANKGYAKYSAGELSRAGKQCGFAVDVNTAANGKALCLVCKKVER
jgi:ubiquinone/menaquinone biosynthesis C-methylase UbiE